MAQYVHQDPRTGLYSLHDVFDAIATSALPVAQSLGVFIQLTELHSTSTALRLRLVDVDRCGRLCSSSPCWFQAATP